jgi:hypothetical protein
MSRSVSSRRPPAAVDRELVDPGPFTDVCSMAYGPVDDRQTLGNRRIPRDPSETSTLHPSRDVAWQGGGEVNGRATTHMWMVRV